MGLYTVKVKLISLLEDEFWFFFCWVLSLLIFVVECWVSNCVCGRVASEGLQSLEFFFVEFWVFDKLTFFPVFLLFTITVIVLALFWYKVLSYEFVFCNLTILPNLWLVSGSGCWLCEWVSILTLKDNKIIKHLKNCNYISRMNCSIERGFSGWMIVWLCTLKNI